MGDERRCMECCEQECREKCRQQCCDYDPCCDRNPCCDNNSSGIWIIILLVVLYLLFCGDNKGGGLFGGLF